MFHILLLYKSLFITSYILAFGFVHVLIIIAIFFFILIVLAVVKSIRLRKESERLSKASLKNKEDFKYQDFTEGHLYENNNK